MDIIDQLSNDCWKVWEVVHNRKHVAIQGCEIGGGVTCIKIHSSINMAHELVNYYLAQGNLLHKWVQGCSSSGERLNVYPHGKIIESKFGTKLFGILPQKYLLNVLISGEKHKDMEFTYFKSLKSNKKSKVELFCSFQTVFFEEEKITFLNAKIIVKPGSGYFNQLLAKQLALDMGRSVAHFECFLIDHCFLIQCNLTEKSNNIMKQLANNKVEKKQEAPLTKNENTNRKTQQVARKSPALQDTPYSSNKQPSKNADSKQNKNSKKSEKSKREEYVTVEEQVIEVDDEEVQQIMNGNYKFEDKNGQKKTVVEEQKISKAHHTTKIPFEPEVNKNIPIEYELWRDL